MSKLGLLLLLVFIGVLTWPVFVFASSILSYFGGEAWQLEAWSLIPKRVLLQQFLDGYQQSLIVALPAGVLAVVDYLLLSRFRSTRSLRGILLPISAVALAIAFQQSIPGALPVLLLSGVLLAVAYRLYDLLLSTLSRGSKH